MRLLRSRIFFCLRRTKWDILALEIATDAHWQSAKQLPSNHQSSGDLAIDCHAYCFVSAVGEFVIVRKDLRWIFPVEVRGKRATKRTD